MSGRKDTRLTRAFPIVVSGPSGVGKTTLVNGLLAGDSRLRESVSATTRPARDGEIEGDSYFFVSNTEFEALKDGKLVEWAKVHGHSYGTPRDFLEKELASGVDVVMNIDVQGGASVRKSFPNALLIFILPPSLAVLEERIRQRGTDEEKVIAKRLDNARGEIRLASDYDFVVINDDLEETVQALCAIVKSERHRTARYADDFVDKFIEGS
jgi:guanylate kinase